MTDQRRINPQDRPHGTRGKTPPTPAPEHQHQHKADKADKDGE